VTLSGDLGERGKVVEIEEAMITIREDGAEKVVHQSEIVSSISFSDDPSTEEALRDYQERCQRRGYPPSWGVLVDVLTHADADVVAGTYSVTLEHVEQAIAALDALCAPGASPILESSSDEGEDTDDAEQALGDDPTGPAEMSDTSADDAEQAGGDPEPDNVVQLKAPSKAKTERKPRGKAIAS
jgi:hypothetical protein